MILSRQYVFQAHVGFSVWKYPSLFTAGENHSCLCIPTQTLLSDMYPLLQATVLCSPRFPYCPYMRFSKKRTILQSSSRSCQILAELMYASKTTNPSANTIFLIFLVLYTFVGTRLATERINTLQCSLLVLLGHYSGEQGINLSTQLKYPRMNGYENMTVSIYTNDVFNHPLHRGSLLLLLELQNILLDFHQMLVIIVCTLTMC